MLNKNFHNFERMGGASTVSAKPTIKRTFGWFDALAAAFVLVLAGLVFLSFYGRSPSGPLTATVTLDGETIGVYTLPGMKEELLLTPDDLSYPLTIRLSSDGAEVMESTCPTLDCQHTGKIHRSGESIICLPNKLVIRLSGGSDEGVDAVLG